MQREICHECHRETKHGLANHKCKKRVPCEFCLKKIKLYKLVRHSEKCEVLQKILNSEPEMKDCPHCQKRFPLPELPDHIYAHEISISSREVIQVIHRPGSHSRIPMDSRNLNRRMIELLRRRNPDYLNNYSGLQVRRSSVPSKASNIPKPEIVNRLPVIRFDGKSKVTCTICLSLFKEGKRIKTLPCFHQFHKRCIDTWLETSCLCPVCKESI